MHTYWLDWFAENLFETENKNRPEGTKPYESVEHCFREVVQAGVRMWGNPVIQNESSERSANAWFADKIAPFAGVALQKPHLAIAVSRTTLLDCPWAEADENIEQCGKDIVLGHSVIYLDLAERVFMMPGGVFQVRALFVWHDGTYFRFSTVLTRPGTDKGWWFSWCEGRHARSSVDRVFDDVFAPASTLIEDRHRPINRQKIDFDRFADVENLVWVSLANWKMATEFGTMPMPQMPMPTIHNNPMLEDSFDDDLVLDEPFSMFKVVRLPALDEFRVQQVRQRVSGMKYGPRRRKTREHEVSGFYRWQPYGPGRKLRKEIWVEGFRRGQGAPKSVMNVLPAADLAA